MADYEITPASDALRTKVQGMIDAKTKPLGSLGQIERLVKPILRPTISPPRITATFCATA